MKQRDKKRMKELELKALHNMAWDDIETFLNKKDREEYLILVERI